MMKSCLIILFLIFFATVFSQTYERENAILYEKYESGEFNQYKYASIAKKWNQLIEKVKAYPELPLNEDSVVYYTYVSDFPGVEKDRLFNQTLEWLSIDYGLYPSFIYTNKEDGRIIYDFNFSINRQYSGYYTAIVTIINGKVVLEFTNIYYEAFFEGHYAGETWISDKTVHYEIDELYPVILKESDMWSVYLHFFKTTNNAVFDVVKQLRKFNEDYIKKYPF